MKISVRTGLAGLLLCLALAVPALAGPAVSLRVEGEAKTLLPRTAFTLPDTVEPTTKCPANSAANALEVGTKGNWDHKAFVETILGETHKFDRNDYWNFWVFRGGRYLVADGACTERLAAGEEFLATYQVADAQFAPTVFPLFLENVPGTVKPGQSFTVTVKTTKCQTSFCNVGEGQGVAAAGVTVTAGPASAVSDAAGKATLTLSAGGPADVQGKKTGSISTAVERTCVTTGADGFCGYAIPGATPTPTPVATAVSTCPPVEVCDVRPVDRTAPVSRITGLTEGRRFKRGKGPRTLRATITEAVSLAGVDLSLTRSRRGRCSAFDGTQERFARVRCGLHPSFAGPVSDRISFLLPSRLGPGRYVFDVVGTDRAGNREGLYRGRNRVVFTVR